MFVFRHFRWPDGQFVVVFLALQIELCSSLVFLSRQSDWPSHTVNRKKSLLEGFRSLQKQKSILFTLCLRYALVVRAGELAVRTRWVFTGLERFLVGWHLIGSLFKQDQIFERYATS